MQRVFLIIFSGVLQFCSMANGGVSVVETNYMGWTNAVEISNEAVRIVVVPDVGRIIHYSFAGDKNLFYVNPEMAGVVFGRGVDYLVDGKPKTPNIGGDRVLPSSQNYTHLVRGSRHLADPWITSSPCEYTLLKDGVRIETPISKLQGIKFIRTVTLDPHSSRVKIDQQLKKIHPAKDEACDAIPLTIWNLTKLRPPKATWMPLREDSVHPGGFAIPEWPDAKNYAGDNCEVQNGILKVLPVTENGEKVGADAAGWVAGLVDDVLMVEYFIPDPDADYPDGGMSAAIFSCARFTELECLSPRKILKPGESIEHVIWWELKKIKNQSELLDISSLVK
jgi:hypothetical protein